MSETTKLLPCPFCGGRADFEECGGPTTKPDSASWSVGCMNDKIDCIGYQMLARFSRKSEAATAWNTRAASHQTGSAGWQPIETAPNDGTPFLAVVVDTVDEFDEDDRCIARGKKEVGVFVAQQVKGLGGPIVIPWTGSIIQNRKFTHWMPLPSPPSGGTQ